ncbi:MAG: hypothetical protein KAT65_17535, partial [Methanophagales archaeon]|nr:hypothetical protein [Methanophagales archaeon]
MKKTFAIVLIVAVLALIALTSSASAVPIGNHDITFISHTFDGTYSTWTYNVTSGYKPALSHWVITWCNESALINCSETCEYVTNEPHTGITGIKFDKEYNDNESRIVWFRLLGDWPEDMVKVGTKAGADIDYGNVTGPVCCKPDLIIENKTASWADGTLTVTYTVANCGPCACAAACPSTTGIYVGGVQVASDPTVPALDKCTNYANTVVIPGIPCPCGETITVKVLADKHNDVDECDEDNNWSEENVITCPGMPDLVVEKSVTFTDGTFIVNYTVTNQGCGPANESTTCKFVNGMLMESQPCPALGSGESHSGTFDPEPCPCGATLNVTVCADNDNVVEESDETNNCEVNEVKCPGVPDLVVEKNVTIVDGTFIVNYTVTNQGCGPANASTTCKFVNGTLMESQPCPPLGSGASHSGEFEPEECPCGATLNVTVCADNDNNVAESDETNNCEVNVVKCPGVPDLVVEKNVTIVDGTFIV